MIGIGTLGCYYTLIATTLFALSSGNESLLDRPRGIWYADKAVNLSLSTLRGYDAHAHPLDNLETSTYTLTSLLCSSASTSPMQLQSSPPSLTNTITPRSRLPYCTVENFPLTSLPVRDVSGFGHNLNAYLVRGTSMWIHVPPTDASPHYGRWATLLAKSFNSLRCPQIASRTKSSDGTEKGIGMSTIFLPALRRHAVLGRSWVRDMLMAALGSASSPCMQKVGMPRLLFWDDIEGLTTEWIVFERLVMVSSEVVGNDLQDWTAIFSSPEASEAFREAVLRQSHLETPFKVQLRPKPIITLLLSADDAAGFSNNGEILSALRSVAGTTYSVRPYSATLDAPLASFASVMRNTHILIARHGERLANALFMPTNATVIEIAPYGCEEGETSGMYSSLFKNTHLRHLVWRAPMDCMRYRSWADARYAEWTASECAASIECQEARSSAAVYVETERLIDLVHESMNPRQLPWSDA